MSTFDHLLDRAVGETVKLEIIRTREFGFAELIFILKVAIFGLTCKMTLLIA
jgi:hypothetical protein